MLVAGAAWAAFSVLAADLGSRHRLRAFLPVGTLAAAVVALAVAFGSAGPAELLGQSAETWIALFLAACTLTAMVVSWVWLVVAVDVVRPSALLFLPAVTFTLFGVFERRVSVAGPSPLLWQAVAWGSIVTASGALGVWLLFRVRPVRTSTDSAEDTLSQLPSGPAPRPALAARRFAFAAAALSAIAAVTAAVALLSPALTAQVEGVRGTGEAYSAAWTLPGAETPTVWLTCLAAALVLVVSVGFARGAWVAGKALTASVCAALVAAAVPALLMTPLRTWTRWIPTDVQHDYGTEYARLTLAQARGWVGTTAVVLAATAALALAIGALLALRTNAETTKAA
jgi:hypothetical protein